MLFSKFVVFTFDYILATNNFELSYFEQYDVVVTSNSIIFSS